MKFTFSQRTADLILIFAAILWFAGCVFGCKSVEKYKASPKFPQDCADKFPPKVISGKPDTIIIQGITIDCDSVIAANGKDTVTLTNTVTVTNTVLQPNRVDCPPQKIIKQIDTVISTAALEACQRTLYEERASYQRTIDKMQYDADRLHGKFSNRTKQRNWLFAIVAAAALYSQRHRILNLFA
jgi:hypothetical protein